MDSVEISQLKDMCKAYVPDAVTAFLGGSRGVQNNALSTSDYDIVVMVPYQDYPTSYNGLCHPVNGQKIDLIIRDPETLAFDLDVAHQTAKAAVPRMIASGVPIFDDADSAMHVHSYVSRFVQQGPMPMDAKHYQQKCTDIFTMLDDAKSDQAYDLAWIEAAHKAGKAYLRASRSWVASGKIVGRDLLMHPQAKKEIEESYASRDRDRLYALMAGQKDVQTFMDARDDIALAAAHNEIRNELRDPFLAQYEQDKHRDILCNGTNEQKNLLKRFAANKLLAIVDAVNPERIGRSSNEYFYALARVVMTSAHFVHAQSHEGSADKYAILLDAYPQFYDDTKKAEQGNPNALNETVADIACMFDVEAGCKFTRVAPSTFRSTPQF